MWQIAGGIILGALALIALLAVLTFLLGTESGNKVLGAAPTINAATHSESPAWKPLANSLD
jgi:hypothetical protein